MATYAESGFQQGGMATVSPQQARTQAWAAAQQAAPVAARHSAQQTVNLGPHPDVATLAAAVAAVAATRSPARHPGPVVVMHTGTGSAPVVVYPAGSVPYQTQQSPQRAPQPVQRVSAAAQTEQPSAHAHAQPAPAALPAGPASPPPKWVHPSNVSVSAAGASSSPGAGEEEGATAAATAARRGQIAEAIRRFREEPPRPREQRAGSATAPAATGAPSGYVAPATTAAAGMVGGSAELDGSAAAGAAPYGAAGDAAGSAVDAVATALLARSRALLREKDAIQQRIQTALQSFKADGSLPPGGLPTGLAGYGASGLSPSGQSTASPGAGCETGAGAGTSTSPVIGSEDTVSWRQRLVRRCHGVCARCTSELAGVHLLLEVLIALAMGGVGWFCCLQR